MEVIRDKYNFKLNFVIYFEDLYGDDKFFFFFLTKNISSLTVAKQQNDKFPSTTMDQHKNRFRPNITYLVRRSRTKNLHKTNYNRTETTI